MVPAPVPGRLARAGLLLLLSCSAADRGERAQESSKAAPDSAPASLLHFRGRSVDLRPFLLGFPYSGFRADLEHDLFLYLEQTPAGSWLRSLRPGSAGALDLSAGRKLAEIDWSTRSLQRIQAHPDGRRLFLIADQRNDEVLNVYVLDRESGALSQLTQNDYTYGFELSKDGRYLAHLSRRGREEPFDTGLLVRDLDTGVEREVLRDGGGADRFTWSPLRFTPDNRSLLLVVQHDGQRDLTSLARVDLESATPAFEYLTPPRVLRLGLALVEGFLSDHEVLYVTAESGYRNIHHLDLASGAITPLTAFEEELGSVRLLATEPPTVLCVLDRTIESELLLLDARSGRTLLSKTLPASASLMDSHGDRAVLSLTSLETPWQAERLTVAGDGGAFRFEFAPLAGVPDAVREQTQHLTVRKIEYPTFDRQEGGSPRLLHAFLLEPRRPPPPAERLALVTAFYGGGNRFNMQAQLFAALGISTLSPAPRGSSGFGARFAELNDGDLGGDEIVDIHYAARWLVEHEGYEPRQIGVHGGSHGGYATMRCLTFPPETNGRGVTFDYGFGWSHAGFSDILTFYDSSNIPDWVVKEAGDPTSERTKLLDRSPISHVDKLRAPLLLTHGSNDWRVPADESRRFAAAAHERGKPVTLVEFPGQGHAIRGFENQVRYYQTVLSFLEQAAAAR